MFALHFSCVPGNIEFHKMNSNQPYLYAILAIQNDQVNFCSKGLLPYIISCFARDYSVLQPCLSTIYQMLPPSLE